MYLFVGVLPVVQSNYYTTTILQYSRHRPELCAELCIYGRTVIKHHIERKVRDSLRGLAFMYAVLRSVTIHSAVTMKTQSIKSGCCGGSCDYFGREIEKSTFTNNNQ